jgi:hypothetical protein
MSELVVDKNRNRSAIGIIIVVILSLGVGSVAWWMHAHPSFDRFDAALAAMKAHQVKADGSGRVDFSKDFPGLVPQDQAYVSWLEDGTFRAMFPTDLGGGSALTGLMYTSRPLTEDDTRPRSSSAIHFDQRLIKVGSYDGLVLDKKLSDSWYQVSFRIH